MPIQRYPSQQLSFPPICRRENRGLEWLTYGGNDRKRREEAPENKISGASSRSLVMKMLSEKPVFLGKRYVFCVLLVYYKTQ